jgi:hypothetical protein
MSLALFDDYLRFAEEVLRHGPALPSALNLAELESALTSYGVVLLHSQMEQSIKKAVGLRCSRITDVEARAFANSIVEEKTGKLRIEALNQTLNRFGSNYKKNFGADLTSSGLNGSWDSIVNQRKTVAHEGTPATLSLADLRKYYSGILEVLGYYCKALQLTTPEIQSISPLIVT